MDVESMEKQAVRQIKDIPELVEKLRDLQTKKKDWIVPTKRISFEVDEMFVTNENTKKRELVGGTPYLEFCMTEAGGTKRMLVQNQAMTQICTKLEIPKRYFDRCLKFLPGLARENVEKWMRKEGSAEKPKKRLIRTISGQIRAFLSDRFRPIDHLDVLTTAVQVVTGQDGNDGEEKPWARGARCVESHLTVTHMNVALANPGVWVDLEKIEEGVKTDSPDDGDVIRRLLRRGLADDTTDWTDTVVYPSARLVNSETGHGELEVMPGLCEGFCVNLNWYGKGLMQRHLGKQLDMEEDLSAETFRKMNAVIFSKTSDIVRSVFEPEKFLEQCRKFKGLQEIEVNVSEAIDSIVKMPGVTEGLRDDILTKYGAYKAVRKATKDTLFDLNRAVTDVAQDQKAADTTLALQELGGAMIERGLKALEVK